MAGGGPKYGPGEGHFFSVPWAKQGDLGSKVLPKTAPGTVWTAGSVVEVGWGLRYNHGGGYQYRLCPAGEELTEDCFSRHPLIFAGASEHYRDYGYQQALRWTDGTEEWINGTLVWVTPPHVHPHATKEKHHASKERGPNPVGYPWALNPIPRIHFDSSSSGQPAGWSGCTEPAIGAKCIAFAPPCTGDTGWKQVNGTRTSPNDVQGKCSGDATTVTIIDRLEVPTSLAPGAYVLGWRWDCEETAQVWSSCADVFIDVAPPPPPTQVELVSWL